LNGTASLREVAEHRRWGHPRKLTRLARQMRLIRVARVAPLVARCKIDFGERAEAQAKRGAASRRCL
jgi:hypothetical protein